MPNSALENAMPGQALSVVHLLAACHVAVVGFKKILVHDLDRLDGQRIGEHSVKRGHISLDGVGQRVHTGVRGQVGRHGLCQRRVNDGHVGGDVEICQRVLDALGVVGDNGERGHLGGCAGCGRDRQEFGLLSQLREVKRSDEILEGGVRVLVERPHGLRRVDGGTAAHGNNPVGLVLSHHLGALHHRLNGRIRLHILKKLRLDAGFL